jgi:hypothetical protein
MNLMRLYIQVIVAAIANNKVGAECKVHATLSLGKQALIRGFCSSIYIYQIDKVTA